MCALRTCAEMPRVSAYKSNGAENEQERNTSHEASTGEASDTGSEQEAKRQEACGQEP